MQPSFVPINHFKKAIEYWWVIVALMILGGVSGWLLSIINQPLYESKATLSTSIDYVQSGYLTDIEEDQILNLVGDNLLSDVIMDAMVIRMSDLGQSFSLADIRESIFIERQGYHWILRARNENASLAQVIVANWTEIVEDEFNTYLYHANMAEAIKRRIIGLEECYSQQIWVDPSSPLCSQKSAEEIRNEISIENREFLSELKKGHGIDPAARFAITMQASAPYQVANTRNEMVFAGSVMGLFLGLIVIISPAIEKITKSSRREK